MGRLTIDEANVAAEELQKRLDALSLAREDLQKRLPKKPFVPYTGEEPKREDFTDVAAYKDALKKHKYRLKRNDPVRRELDNVVAKARYLRLRLKKKADSATDCATDCAPEGSAPVLA